MSAGLKTIDLTGVAVGFSDTIDFQQFVKVASNNPLLPANISLFNESGCGVDLMFTASNNAHYLPAGGWGTFPLASNDGSLKVTVTYVLPNPPVSKLHAIYYAPGEPVPANFTLGNSPIGIGGSIQTDFSVLTNTGNGPLSVIVTVLPSDALSPTWLADNSGNLTIKSDNAGVLTTLLQLIAGASPEVKLAAVGVLTSILGSLSLAGTVNGVYIDDNGGASDARIGSAVASPGDVLDAVADGNTTLSADGGRFAFESPSGTPRWSFSAANTGTVAASGTVNHSLPGTPKAVLLTPDVSGSTWTFSAHTYTSTQFGVTLNSALLTRWWAYS